MVAASVDSKAAEDRHIGFRWLCRAARLDDEEDAESLLRAVANVLPADLRELWERARPRAVPLWERTSRAH